MNNHDMAEFITAFEDYKERALQEYSLLQEQIHARYEKMVANGNDPKFLKLSPHDCFVLFGRVRYGHKFFVKAGSLIIGQSRSHTDGEGDVYYEPWSLE